jgi:hypothetical protein
MVLLVAYRICGYPLAPLVRTLGVAAALAVVTWAAARGTSLVYGGLTGLIAGALVALLFSAAVARRLLAPMSAAIASAK